MNQAATMPRTQDIVVEDVFAHAPEIIWKALTDGSLIRRWMMEPKGFEPVVGNRFTFTTKPAGAWDGTIQCEVLEVVENERLAYRWTGGHEANVGYGSRLDTVVTFTLDAGRQRYAASRGSLGLRRARKRHGLRQYEPGLAGVLRKAGRCFRHGQHPSHMRHRHE